MSARPLQSEERDREIFDVVIVGGGVAGAIVAKELCRDRKRVLMLEAGTGDLEWSSYESYLNTFYQAPIKVPNSPYPKNPFAAEPSVLDIETSDDPAKPYETTGYFKQTGPLPFSSDYLRRLGGTTLHWLGTCLRMLPDDFNTRSRYGVGLDWPLDYDDLNVFYEKAEEELGVAGDVSDQEYLGLHFTDGYRFPMQRMPPSYLDRFLGSTLDGRKMRIRREKFDTSVVSTPQARNGVPNPEFNGGKGYSTIGAVGRPLTGHRCEGNANCVPICPVQAKYTALRTLASPDESRLKVETQCVATEVLHDNDRNVEGIRYKRYRDGHWEDTRIARGRIYVLAANAIENAKLLLASGLNSATDLVGRHLMDHPTFLVPGYAPKNIGAFRGPLSTSGIPGFRNGAFRERSAAFRIECDNSGNAWANGDPGATVNALIDQGLRREELWRAVRRSLPTEVQINFLMEQLPNPLNRVTIDPNVRTKDGELRPVIHYDLTSYEKEGFRAARRVSRRLFRRARIRNATTTDPSSPTYFQYRGTGFQFSGAGHLAGTHIMGSTPNMSVVDENQKFWGLSNLYAIGCGSMPNMGTSNPTLTLAALSYKTAKYLIERAL